jgi:tRNA threonylcarbamoyl adenosine modification protein (Sua5/YciO/YrdC/YwlC family)
MILTVHPENPEPRKIRQAAEVLRQGGVIAYPTGTVIGLGCDLMSKRAVEKLHLIKGAKKDKPFSFLCADLTEISHYAHVSDAAYRIMRRLVPGPYTFVLPATKEAPRLSKDAKRKTVGIRVPHHPVPLALVRALGNPIISTSAQRTGDDWFSNDPEEVEEKFKQLDLVIDAGMGGLTPSTILAFDAAGNVEVLREGAGPIEDILG